MDVWSAISAADETRSMNATCYRTCHMQILDSHIANNAERSSRPLVGIDIGSNCVAVTIEGTAERLSVRTNHARNGDVCCQDGVELSTLSRLFYQCCKGLPVLARIDDIILLAAGFVLTIHLSIITVVERHRCSLVMTGKSGTANHVERQVVRRKQAVGHLDVALTSCNTDETTVTVSFLALERAKEGTVGDADFGFFWHPANQAATAGIAINLRHDVGCHLTTIDDGVSN